MTGLLERVRRIFVHEREHDPRWDCPYSPHGEHCFHGPAVMMTQVEHSCCWCGYRIEVRPSRLGRSGAGERRETCAQDGERRAVRRRAAG
ncbi:hypothetical protein dsx2_3388 [Desulfovibrio sp. X2]|uniref:hypothetical protein n=1 Tax=Desulfovibrio sp. X2 TaxID=941449 RepID=UPI00035871CA|nr:hypothetical protein [Desulfovibrio sp. X2]EPR39989.1 hypothetical protein dsx2_3388 [Desulfovibrio sp. X2]